MSDDGREWNRRVSSTQHRRCTATWGIYPAHGVFCPSGRERWRDEYDARNVGLYFGLDEALTKAGRPAAERADALLAFPDQPKLPAALVYVLAQSLAEAGRFDEADGQFVGRFFPREEGGVNARQVYLEVKLRRAIALAKAKECVRALDLAGRLAEPVDGLGSRGGRTLFSSRRGWRRC
jgi:hypothetical protein